MKRTPYQIAKVKEIKDKVIILYKQGLTTRQIEVAIDGRRKRMWVCNVIKEYEKNNKLSTD
jgi:hypothetical protein